MRWTYGITTVPARRDTYLPITLSSLANAGFEKPRLFVDGAKDVFEYAGSAGHLFGLEITTRYPVIKTHGNWVLAMLELFIREPNCERYVIFQDDIVACRNLRQYLEHVPYPKKAYLNLYTYRTNQMRAPSDKPGWFVSNQKGKGAQALVFDREAVLQIVCSRSMHSRPMNEMVTETGWKRGQVNIDGGIGDAMKAAGWHEYCHNPSLVQHIGDVTSMGNLLRHVAPNFIGKDADAMSLIPKPEPVSIGATS